MIYKQDLKDFYIEMNRMLDPFIKLYEDDRRLFENIKYSLDKLLNDYFIHELDMINICNSLNDELICLSIVMLEEDYKTLIKRIIGTLKVVLEDMERQEKYEQCFNIKDFIDMFIEVKHYNSIKRNKDIL